VTLPVPLPGLVIRYSFLWSREARLGATEGRKDRPCAIVVATRPDLRGETNVVVVPVTHTSPTDTATAIELLPEVKAALGLDRRRSWVCLDEVNTFIWPGYDLRRIPGTRKYDHGVLPEALFLRIRDGVVALHRSRRLRQVTRD
jgi:uncharacterized protein YifN (PemK superfamily)